MESVISKQTSSKFNTCLSDNIKYFFRRLTQIGLGVGAVYVTVQQGVWGSNNQGVEAFEKVKRSVLPAANSYLQEIPSISDVRSTILKKWNSGVKTVFTGVENTPVYVKKAYDKAVDAVDKK